MEKSSFTSDEESVGEEQFEEVLGLDVKSESDEEEFNDQFDVKIMLMLYVCCFLDNPRFHVVLNK